jgi:hypothetical protein
MIQAIYKTWMESFNPLPPLNEDGQAIYKTWSDESELILTSNGLEKDNG